MAERYESVGKIFSRPEYASLVNEEGLNLEALTAKLLKVIAEAETGTEPSDSPLESASNDEAQSADSSKEPTEPKRTRLPDRFQNFANRSSLVHFEKALRQGLVWSDQLSLATADYQYEVTQRERIKAAKARGESTSERVLVTEPTRERSRATGEQQVFFTAQIAGNAKKEKTIVHYWIEHRNKADSYTFASKRYKYVARSIPGLSEVRLGCRVPQTVSGEFTLVVQVVNGETIEPYQVSIPSVEMINRYDAKPQPLEFDSREEMAADR